MSQSKTGSTPITFAVTGGTNDFDVKILYKGVLASTFKEQNLVAENGKYSGYG